MTQEQVFMSDKIAEIQHGTQNLDMTNDICSAFKRQLLEECFAMAGYASNNGLKADPEDISELSQMRALDVNHLDIRKLYEIHKKLSAVIEPATPSAIALIYREKKRNHFFLFLGPVPLIRQLSAISIFFLLMLIFIGLSPDVNQSTIVHGIMMSEGRELLLNLLFLLACAGLGASFSALFQANNYIASMNYDPRYDSSYWSRILLGLISGLILVELLPANIYQEGSMKTFGKPALAILGGFSATLVHRVLQRLVDTLESLVKGDPRSTRQATEYTARAKLSEEKAKWDMDVIKKIMNFQAGLDDNQSVEEIKRQFNEFANTLSHSDKIKINK